MYKIIKEFKSPTENDDYLYLVESYDNHYLIFKTLDDEGNYYFSDYIHIDLKSFCNSILKFIESDKYFKPIENFKFDLFSYIGYYTIEISYLLDVSYVSIIELKVEDLLEGLSKLT